MTAPDDAPLHGRVALVTGATSGIGQETAAGLAARGAHVVLVGRDPARAEAARRDVAARAGHDRVDVLLADFASLDAVRGLAAQVLERYPKLHLLVNNAGVVHTSRRTTGDGYESTLAVNHLAPFLLTALLRERLVESAPARIVNVASEAHRFVSGFDFDDPMSLRKFGFPPVVSGMRVYAMSKLANLLFTAELARRLEGRGVVANSLHPGTVATRLGANNGLFGRLTTLAMRPFFLTPEQGAATSLHVACEPGLEKTSGLYFDACKPRRPSAGARDADAARRLWRESVAWTGAPEPA
jgi:NAD(P)-dependent dehydrogenase (short-subunit alcohol dehydrogenase family)